MRVAGRIFSSLLLAGSALGIASAQNPLYPQSDQSSPGYSSPCTGSMLDPDCNNSNNPNNGNEQQGQFPMLQGNQYAQQLYGNYNRTLVGNMPNGPETGNVTSTRPIPPILTKSDFQVFAENAAGEVLQVYGRDLFDQGPSTFPVVDNIPVPDDYVIGPDDELHVEIWGMIDADISVTVDRNGRIFIPRAGSIGVAGLHYDQLEEYIGNVVAKYFKKFHLSVTLGRLRSIQVFVLGSARQPGVYTVSALSTLVDALFACGGPSASGSMRSIELRRDDRVVARLDIYDLLRRGDKSHDAKLMPNDIIYFPPVGPQVAIVGNVQDPGIYELKNDLSIAGALDNAGGLTVMASTERALLERIENRKLRNVDEITLDEFGLHRKLRDGDVLRVEPVSPQFAGTVMLRGSVAVPGRYQWLKGMRVSDLIPDRASLITRDHWIQQNQLVEYQQNRIAEKQQAQLQQAQLIDEARLNQAQLGIGQQEADFNQQPAALASTILGNNVQSGQPFETAAPQGAGTAVPQGAAPGGAMNQHSLPGQPGATPAAQQSPVPGSQAGAPSGETQQNAYQPLDLMADLNLTDAEINWDYAAIERLDERDLSTHVIAFNLGKALDDPTSSDNKVLMPGDVVVVFSKKDLSLPEDKHAAFVQIDGEVNAPGTYRIEPGETLRQVVERAGGLTSRSYLYAAQLTRVSTRLEEEQELQLSINEMQKDLVSRYAAAPSVNPAYETDQRAQLEAQRAVVNQLSAYHPTGRVVLSMNPNASTVADIPDFPLEDGDKFHIPARLDTVQVAGAVYNESAFRYQPGRRLSAYLKDAGGSTREADVKRIFLIRADGDVVSRQSRGQLWRDDFDDLVLLPGDAIVVPTKLKSPSNFAQQLPYLTQILSSAALTGAVISAAY